MAITFPVSFLFRPTDYEVIKHYLLKKQIGEELPLNGVIQERDVYSEEVLSEVFRSSETHVYFFTQLKKKFLNGSNHDRTVGKATWRSESVDDIRLDEKTVIGKKRVLDYINPGSVGDRDWNMKEFSLDGVLLELPQTSSDYVVCLLEKKERAIKRDRQKNMQSKRNAPVNTPSGCFNNKRIKLSSKQNQQMENQQTKSAPLVDEQVGLINGEAGVETPGQIMQYLTEPDSSMVNVENVMATNTLATLPPSASYDLSECTSMPPLVEDKPAATVDEEGGCTPRKQESRMLPVEKSHWEYQPSIAAPESMAADAVMDSIILLSTTVEGFAEDFIEDFADQFLKGN
ncbi:NAC domain-containing protein 82-like [Actinidia eriantha]|uniref:NAC domain-containing protein 82-like n=1 Tax=Actinidia eriantha TaxID=165200 RepID=UPI00258E008E|nr:NAC domain-containing protein 82-like [Actinidia eriantha]